MGGEEVDVAGDDESVRTDRGGGGVCGFRFVYEVLLVVCGGMVCELVGRWIGMDNGGREDNQPVQMMWEAMFNKQTQQFPRMKWT